MISYDYNLDMVPGLSDAKLVVPVNQYDDDFLLRFHLYARTGDFQLQSGTTARIRGTKPDGNAYSADCTLTVENDDIVITVTGDKQMTAASGSGEYEIALYNGTVELSTANFVLNVERAALDKDTVSSESKVRELIDVIDNSEAIINAGQQYADSQAAMEEIGRQTAEDVLATAQNKADTEALMQQITDLINDSSETIDNKAAQIANLLINSDSIATEALSSVNSVADATASLASLVDEMKEMIEVLQKERLNHFANWYIENDTLYAVNEEGYVIGDPLADIRGNNNTMSTLTMTNTSGYNSKDINEGDECIATLMWSSVESGMPTGHGSLKITVNDIDMAVRDIDQGEVSIDLAPYLTSGKDNEVKLTVSDRYGAYKYTLMNIKVISVSLASDLNASIAYQGPINFKYTPYGKGVNKIMHFVMDGVEIDTADIGGVHRTARSFTIPQQTHGTHVFEAYFECETNGQIIRSNTLHYELICVEYLNPNQIIASSYNELTVDQYKTANIDLTVYDPSTQNATVNVYLGEELVNTLVVDRTRQIFPYRFDEEGEFDLTFTCGTASKTHHFTVLPFEVELEAVKDHLLLHLSSIGRSNIESDPAVWTYGEGEDQVAATFSNFNWTSDGWILDENGSSCLRLLGESTVTIPFEIFEKDFKTNGKTIEIELSTHDVIDYREPMITCFTGNRGIRIYPDKAIFQSDGINVTSTFSTDTKLRLTWVVQPSNDLRLVTQYINGEYQRILQYPATDSFRQNNPVGITIGSPLCGVDIYEIRVYDRALSSQEVLTNYTVDRQDINELLDLYERNWIRDESDRIDYKKLPANLPYVIFRAAALPQTKGDKQTGDMEFYNPLDITRNMLADGIIIDVQGTSSKDYYVKNYKIKLPNGATVNGILMVGYSITADSIVVTTFTLKADVASSESANNIVLAKLYEDLTRKLGIITPPQEDDERIRQGMDGFPFVLFNDYGEGPEFIGKYNFLNDKGTPEVFGFSEGDEAFDVRSSQSPLSAFKTNVFPDNWAKEEYEPIYPEDYTDKTKLQAMTDFIYSTRQEDATNEPLDESVTYEGRTYTTDSAEYRLAKFRDGYPRLYDLDNATFYYVFTLVLLMTDSRQKNEHLTWWHVLAKWWELPYDFDTALGNDNVGQLTAEYWMEDIDRNARNEWIFNGAENVKWVNFRQAFWEECRQMYQRMRSSGIFNTEYIKKIFEDWQSVWPAAIWNEDGDFKYVAPLREENITTYLEMAFGSKHWQRNEFLDWRFLYCDSMFDVGEALSGIVFRPFYDITDEQRLAGAVDLEIEVYKKCYVTVAFDDTIVTKRVIDDSNTCTIENPKSYANMMVGNIHNAKLIKDIRGMANLHVSLWDSSNATNLQAIRLGKADINYRDTNTKSVSVGANRKLTLVDMRGCEGFGTETQTVLDLSHCPNIREVYMDRTSATGIDIPNGGVLEEIHYPATTTHIILRNHPLLTDAKLVVESYANVNRLWLENMGGLDTKTIFNTIPEDSAVRITGFYWEAEDADEIEELFARFETMHGLDINGEEVTDAQFVGTIHTASLRGDQIARWRDEYPYNKYSGVTISASTSSSTLTYKTYNGGTIGTVECRDGVPTEAAPAIPARTSSPQYSYPAIGWNTSAEGESGTITPAYPVTGPESGIEGDTTLYAAYRWDLRSYTITWVNSDNAALPNSPETYNYGDHPSYKGTTPTNPTTGGGPFTGWDPPIQADTIVTGNQTYKASYIPIYTVTWLNDDGTTVLQTDSVQQGNSATYNASTPVSTVDSAMIFNGWTVTGATVSGNTVSNVQANLRITASYKQPSDAPTATTADGAYGVEWNYSNSSPALTRKGLAASFSDPTPATSVSGSGSSPFDNIAPWKDMKRYNVIGNEFVPESDSRFSQTANDTVVYIPEFYYTAYKDTSNSKWLWAISPTPLEGYKKHPGSGKYIGRYHTSGDSSAVYSKSGVSPLVNTSHTDFRAYSSNKSNGWRMLDIASWSALQMLYLVEFANFNSQKTLGKGWNTGSVGSMGGTDAAAYHTIQATGSHNQYRWVEDPFSNVMDWIDGIGASGRTVYTATGGGYTYTTSTTGLESTGVTLPSSNFITGYGYSDKAAWAFLPNAASGGSATTYATDYVNSDTGFKAVGVGGNCGDYDSYGFFCVFALSDASFTYGGLGSRLLKEPA